MEYRGYKNAVVWTFEQKYVLLRLKSTIFFKIP